MKLKFTHNANRDLVRVREFISQKDPLAAERISQRLYRSIEKLTDQPRMGFNVEELPAVRDLVAGDYIVRYTVMAQTLLILRIRHGKENRPV